jgi:hypothetical protein
MPAEPRQTPQDVQRKTQLDMADAENRIDGLFRDPQTDAIFEAYVAGETPAIELVARVRALLGL